MIFPNKINTSGIQWHLDCAARDSKKAVILFDGYGHLAPSPELAHILDVNHVSPADMAALLMRLGTDNVVVIYACSQDDLGLPFVDRLHGMGVKYVPAPYFHPTGYTNINTLARRTLEAEHDHQVQGGFAKWDAGPGDFVNLIQALDITKNVPGCFVEIGCYNGSSSGAVLRYLAAKNATLNTFFLDVFDGFTYEEAFSSCDAYWANTHQSHGFDRVRERLGHYNANAPSLQIVVECNNIIRDPLPAAVAREGIRVANIDVDLYEAVHASLQKTAPLMHQHGIMVVEDPGHTPLLIGARYALDRFLREGGSEQFIPVQMESGSTYLIKK